MLPLVNHESRFGEPNAGVDVVLDDHLALGVVLGMEAADVLAERAAAVL